MNPAYRAHDKYKALYKAMDTPGAVTHFILLAAYESRVEAPQVLLTESVCVSLFGSFRTKIYQDFRVEGLPFVNWACGLNRSDPLVGTGCDMGQFGNDSVTYRRLRALDNALSSGPKDVLIFNGQFTFWFFQAKFTIPKNTGVE